MLAYDLMKSVVLQYHPQIGVAGICNCCNNKSDNLITDSNHNALCIVCSFLATPNGALFGMLTNARAHSPISFINSLLVFELGQPLTLVVTPAYAAKIPLNHKLKVVTLSHDDFILKCINNPAIRVILKPNLRLETYIQTLTISDDKRLTIIQPNGAVSLNISVWQELTLLIKNNSKNIMEMVLSIFEASMLATPVDQLDFIKANYPLFLRMNELLDMLPHSKIMLLRLLRQVLSGMDQPKKPDAIPLPAGI